MKQKSREKKKKPQLKQTGLAVLEATPPWDWPEDARQTFETVLLNKEEPLSERLIAAELAGNFVAINDELAVALMEVLASPTEPETLRARSVISFGGVLERCDLNGFGDPYDPSPITEQVFEGIKRLLHMLYHDDGVPKLVRRRILEASVRAEEKWHKEAIRRAYASEDPEWVLTAVFCMQHIRGFEKEILESLNSKNELVQMHAIEAAGTWEVDAAWSHIYKLLENAETTPKKLLLVAIEAIAKIRNNTPSLEILNHLVDSDDKDVREVADEALSVAGAYTDFDEDDLGLDEDEDASGWIN